MVAKRRSAANSGWSATSQSFSQNFCFAPPITIQPSEAAKFWNGTIDGCAELRRRGGTYPLVAAKVPTYISSCSAVSNSETSQSQPTPSRRARQSPARSAIADA